MWRFFFSLLLACGLGVSASAQIVRVNTNVGDFRLRMAGGSAPGTVQNFLRYVADGDYDGSFFHRLIAGFVLQGGGFYPQDGSAVPTDPPIANEFGISNTRGTVAMAKIQGDPDSATSQWFVNLADNSENLNGQNGGFTVFARVVGGLDVVDRVAGFQRLNLGSLYEGTAAANAVNEVPLTDAFVNGETPLELIHFVTIGDIVPELWADLVFLGGGWARSDWLGDFTVTYDPWIYHNQHGYVYATDGTDQGLWLFFPGSGWMWTARNLSLPLERCARGLDLLFSGRYAVGGLVPEHGYGDSLPIAAGVGEIYFELDGYKVADVVYAKGELVIHGKMEPLNPGER